MIGFGKESTTMAEIKSRIGEQGQRSAVEGLVVFSWWERGGEPGPGYTSDELECSIQNGKARGTYTRARFNQEYDPPFLSEQFSSTVPENLCRGLLDALARENLFSKHFSSEDQSNLADAIKTTIHLSVGGRVEEKTLYNAGPSELAASKDARNLIVKYLFERGNRTVHSQKKKT